MTEPSPDSSSVEVLPGALGGAGLRHVVAVLSTVQIVSYGVLYYAFAALQSSITTDTGWSSIAITGAFSLAQVVSGGVGIWVGRHLDEFGPRRVMTWGSLLAIPGLATIAGAPNLFLFYAGWLVVGAAMGATLYPSAFAALTRWGGSKRVRALTTLTLVAGLASTVFAPLATVLDDRLGWRGAYLVLLAVLAGITVPLHWWGLRHPWRPARHGDDPGVAAAARRHVAAVRRSNPFVLLAVANALAALTTFAVLINLVPMLVEQGMSRNLAAVALGLGGVGQVLGRLGYAPFARATTVTGRTVSVTLALGVATALLAVAPTSAGLLIMLSVVLGLARGMHTLVQATAVTDRWGAGAYGSLNGMLSAPALVAAAAAPFVGAALAHLTGSYSTAFLVLAGVAVVAAALAVRATPGARPAQVL